VNESYLPATADPADLTETTVGDLLVTAAAQAPDHTGRVFARVGSGVTGRWTYRELLAEAERAARALLEQFEPGERVAIWASNRPEWSFVQFGAALAGLVLVTVNPAFRPYEARDVLRRARLAGIVVERASRGNPLRAMVDELRPDLAGVRHVIDLDDWVGFVASADPARALPRVAPSDPVQIQFTSGTTGAP
jgi:fatty-acyl-CoA synthase